LLSDHIASLGVNLKQPQDTGGSKFITTDPRYLLLNKSPNPEQNKTDFWSELVVSILTTGNAFCEIVRDGAGRLVALYPLAAYLVTGWREADGIHYFVAGNPIDASNLLHFKYGVTYPNNIFSVSPITAQRNLLGRMLSQEESMSSMWRNGMRPGGIITSPDVLSDKAKENLRQSVASGNTG
jgi:HK97 family phage portal protein